MLENVTYVLIGLVIWLVLMLGFHVNLFLSIAIASVIAGCIPLNFDKHPAKHGK